MEKFWQIIILFFAFIAACIVSALGIKSMILRRKWKPTFFTTSVIIGLYMLLPGSGRSDTGNDTAMLETDGESSTSKEHTNRIENLQEMEEWQAFKSFWRYMDNIEPGPDGYSSLTMDWDKRASLIEQLTSLTDKLYELPDSFGLDSLHIELLRTICMNRINIFCGSTLMLTRMMPPPTDYRKEELIVLMEGRIDTLIRLRSSGLINPLETASALRNMFEAADAFWLVDAVSREYIRFYISDYYGLSAEIGLEEYTVSGLLETTLIEVEDNFAAMLDSISKYSDEELPAIFRDIPEKYEKTMETIEGIRSVLPDMNLLLADLVIGI